MTQMLVCVSLGLVSGSLIGNGVAHHHPHLIMLGALLMVLTLVGNVIWTFHD